MGAEVRFNHVAPQFAAKNVQASVDFYRETLGFVIDYVRGSPPEYAVSNFFHRSLFVPLQ